jgi:hypothetical protein
MSKPVIDPYISEPVIDPDIISELVIDPDIISEPVIDPDICELKQRSHHSRQASR